MTQSFYWNIDKKSHVNVTSSILSYMVFYLREIKPFGNHVLFASFHKNICLNWKYILSYLIYMKSI